MIFPLVPALLAAAPEPRMRVALTPVAACVASAESLVLDLSVSNPGPSPARLPLWLLQIPAITLEITDLEGRPVAKGPPPVPRMDDGEFGRVVLAPGESLALRFTGSALFGVNPPPGAYRVRYRLELRNWPPAHDWEGVLESPWVDFRVGC